MDHDQTHQNLVAVCLLIAMQAQGMEETLITGARIMTMNEEQQVVAGKL